MNFLSHVDHFGFVLMILAAGILSILIEWALSSIRTWLRRRLSIRSTGGKWVWAIALQLEACGCRHVDLVLGLFFIRWDFGKCRNVPK